MTFLKNGALFFGEIDKYAYRPAKGTAFFVATSEGSCSLPVVSRPQVQKYAGQSIITNGKVVAHGVFRVPCMTECVIMRKEGFQEVLCIRSGKLWGEYSHHSPRPPSHTTTRIYTHVTQTDKNDPVQRASWSWGRARRNFNCFSHYCHPQ